MKKIALSVIAALLLTVGAYHLALLMGARDPAATALAAFVVFAAVADFAVAFVAAVAALSVTFPVTFPITVATITIAIAAIAAVEQERIRFRWVAPAYAVEGLAIWGALAIGNTGWSIAIAFGGIAALLALWYAHARFAALDAPPSTKATLEHNGA